MTFYKLFFQIVLLFLLFNDLKLSFCQMKSYSSINRNRNLKNEYFLNNFLIPSSSNQAIYLIDRKSTENKQLNKKSNNNFDQKLNKRKLSNHLFLKEESQNNFDTSSYNSIYKNYYFNHHLHYTDNPHVYNSPKYKPQAHIPYKPVFVRPPKKYNPLLILSQDIERISEEVIFTLLPRPIRNQIIRVIDGHFGKLKGSKNMQYPPEMANFGKGILVKKDSKFYV